MNEITLELHNVVSIKDGSVWKIDKLPSIPRKNIHCTCIIGNSLWTTGDTNQFISEELKFISPSEKDFIAMNSALSKIKQEYVACCLGGTWLSGIERTTTQGELCERIHKDLALLNYLTYLLNGIVKTME
jgi:hypothetical protein